MSSMGSWGSMGSTGSMGSMGKMSCASSTELQNVKKLYRLNLSNKIYSKKNAYIATNLTLRLNEIEMNGYFWGEKAKHYQIKLV